MSLYSVCASIVIPPWCSFDLVPAEEILQHLHDMVNINAEALQLVDHVLDLSRALGKVKTKTKLITPPGKYREEVPSTYLVQCAQLLVVKVLHLLEQRLELGARLHLLLEHGLQLGGRHHGEGFLQQSIQSTGARCQRY